MNQKKVLFLGGAFSQIPIIQEAKRRGYYIVTCDYLPNNPGHKLADRYFNVSTIDKEGVLAIAKKIKPNFIIAYASDIAAPTAAYVSEMLNLPTNPYNTIKILTEKDIFRDFLRNNGFNSPKSIGLTIDDNLKEKVKDLKFPLMVKPTDSAGSKGVSKVYNNKEFIKAFNYALSFSNNKRVIAEEYINSHIADLHGDGFVINGKLAFIYLGDHYYSSKANPFNPNGTVWPTKQPTEIVKAIEKDVALIIEKSGFENGPINIEARVNGNGEKYIMEIGPRNGGHFVPQAIKYATGFDMVKATLDILSYNRIFIPKNKNLFSAYWAIYSDVDGILKSLKIENELNQFIKEFHQYTQIGEKVKSFKGANAAIGILLLLFTSREEMNFYMSNMEQFVKFQIEKSKTEYCQIT